MLENHDAVTEPKAQPSLWSRMTRTRGRRIALAATAAFSVIGLTAGTVSALTTTQSAGSVTSQQFATNDLPTTAIGSSWTNVPGAAVTVTVPSGTSRVLDARFTAESQCVGSGYCSARVVYQRSGGAVTELRPVSGADFAFDSPGGTWESHAMERSSARLSAGTYRVWVQAVKVGTVSTYRLDDTHFAVSVNS